MSETHQHNGQIQTAPTAVAEKPLVITVNGCGNNIHLVTAQGGGSSCGGGSNQTGTGSMPPAPEPPASPLWTYSRRVGAFLVGATTVGAGLVAIAPAFR
ncbi:hypothetical protein ACFU9B_39290 [Streptomyces sp. NPDC057592]|uniref:hypothetical protein n=1 Tax=unclassified Streptomyces TaxID=2593676 RepID=UPI0036870122